MATTYTKTVNGLTYTITDNGSVALGLLGHSYTATIKDSSGNYILNNKDINTGVLGTGLLGTGGVVIGTDDFTELLSTLTGGTFVTLPGSTGNINIVISLLSGNTFYIGGNTTIDVAVNAIGASTINVYGGTATFSGSLLANALSGSTINIAHGGKFNTGVGLVNILGGSTINFGDGGGTLIANGSSTLINLSGTTINNYNPSKDVIELQGQITKVTSYSISTSNGASAVTLYNGTTEIGYYKANLASGVTLPSGTYTPGSGSNPLSITYDSSNTYIGVCFLEGSMIETPDGSRAVETLAVGDHLTTHDWQNNQTVARPVVWVGKKHATVREGLSEADAGYPVRVLKDALAEGVPYKDLLITPEHCLFFEGRFVPARMLVNGASIIYDKTITSYDYYHVETDEHSVISADGALTESYLNTGNRNTFRQDGPVISIGGTIKNWEADAAAPLCVDREFVEPLFKQLAEKAGNCVAAPQTTADADLHLITDAGAIIRPVRNSGKTYSFMMPANVHTVHIVSRASRPSDVIGPFVDDRRLLGVCVGEISFMAGNKVETLSSHLNAETPEGWYHTEDGQSAWTNGSAILTLGNSAKNKMGMLMINIEAASSYLVAEHFQNSRKTLVG
ncbi:Hint domain-containing protein [Acetobacter indonesiensis]|uniref:Hint domain-containing protein n=1 Tax=Acetobacter indonesiensis TaxID=104101 RepID=UPI0039E9F82F